MVAIYDKDGIVILDAPEYQLKIDNNKRIYVKKPSRKEFTYIGCDLPELPNDRRWEIDDKKRFLHSLYQKIEAKRISSERTPEQREKFI